MLTQFLHILAFETSNLLQVMKKLSFSLVFAIIAVSFLSSCKKNEEVIYSDNTIPDYDQIPSIIIDNYVNRVFIDLIGREPTDVEMVNESASLKSANMSAASRTALVQKLMFNEDPLEGDGSYKEAYFRKFYEDQKGRFLEGSSEALLLEQWGIWRAIAMQDSLNGNTLGYELMMVEANKVWVVMTSREELMNDSIKIQNMCYRMMFNSLYDNINMNSFNFINATFDDCFSRFPTNAEYEAIYPAIEYNGAGSVFGTFFDNKTDYIRELTRSTEFDEGLIRWVYKSLLSREASTFEVYTQLPIYGTESNFSLVQQSILISDEYAGIE
jgi:hypothetical protein